MTMAYDWDKHYKNGGVSGDPADYAKGRAWKMDIIKRYCNLDTDWIADVGCGDLQFWDGKLPKNYIGMDISCDIIRKNQVKYPLPLFICANAATPTTMKVDTVLCFDVLWHIINDRDYECILKNIANNAGKTAIIFTWSANPADEDIVTYLTSALCDLKRGGYQKYRDFLSIATPIFSDFDLVEVAQNPVWKFGSMYVFRRKG